MRQMHASLGIIVCKSTQCVLNTYKVSQNSVQQFKRSCAQKLSIIFSIYGKYYKFKSAELNFPKNNGIRVSV